LKPLLIKARQAVKRFAFARSRRLRMLKACQAGGYSSKTAR
jgi:hypothetical protein